VIDVEPKFEEPRIGKRFRRGFVPVHEHYGPVHDRSLCAMTALLAAVAVNRHLTTHDQDPLGVLALGLYVVAAIVGYGIGKVTPPEYRGVIQVAATTAIGLVGMGSVGGY
jgi:hypothetical protein